MLVKITKIGVPANAADAPASWEHFVPGQKGTNGQSLPIDYELEGTLLAPILLGRQLEVSRNKRNGVVTDGHFSSTNVVEIVVVTRNSIYRISSPDP